LVRTLDFFLGWGRSVVAYFLKFISSEKVE
jgi:hypothetical protein